MHFIDWHNGVFWPAPLAGFALLALGTLAIFAPELGGRAFGLPAHPAHPFVPVVGARDVALGISILGLCAYGEIAPLAIVILSLVVVAMADAVMVLREGTKAVVAVHLAGAIGALLYGAFLWAVSAGMFLSIG
jgi:hypothetical protein